MTPSPFRWLKPDYPSISAKGERTFQHSMKRSLLATSFIFTIKPTDDPAALDLRVDAEASLPFKKFGYRVTTLARRDRETGFVASTETNTGEGFTAGIWEAEPGAVVRKRANGSELARLPLAEYASSEILVFDALSLLTTLVFTKLDSQSPYLAVVAAGSKLNLLRIDCEGESESTLTFGVKSQSLHKAPAPETLLETAVKLSTQATLLRFQWDKAKAEPTRFTLKVPVLGDLDIDF